MSSRLPFQKLAPPEEGFDFTQPAVDLMDSGAAREGYAENNGSEFLHQLAFAQSQESLICVLYCATVSEGTWSFASLYMR